MSALCPIILSLIIDVTVASNYYDSVTAPLGGTFTLENLDRLYTTDDNTRVIMQPGGNFVLLDTTLTVLWASGTHNNDGDYVIINPDDDCNMEIRKANHQPVWTSGTLIPNPSPPCTLHLDSSCLYLLDSDDALLWNVGSKCCDVYNTYLPSPPPETTPPLSSATHIFVDSQCLPIHHISWVNSHQIAWLNVVSCIENQDIFTYHYDKTSIFNDLAPSVISIKIEPYCGAINPYYDDFAVVAEPYSNPVYALRNNRESTYAYDPGTDTISGIGPDTTHWIGSTTAKTRISGNCIEPGAPHNASDRLYDTCHTSENSLVLIYDQNCDWDEDTTTDHDIEIFFGFELIECPTTADPTEYTADPSEFPTRYPSQLPTNNPSGYTADPSEFPSQLPTNTPTEYTGNPSEFPSQLPTNTPSEYTADPSEFPSQIPTNTPTEYTADPSDYPSQLPSQLPSTVPTEYPSQLPTKAPLNTAHPTEYPSQLPTNIPTEYTADPSKHPSQSPSHFPSQLPTNTPTEYTADPSEYPSQLPTNTPTEYTADPSEYPSQLPSQLPSTVPTEYPSQLPTNAPLITPDPTKYPLITADPSKHPSQLPSSLITTQSPTYVFSTTDDAESESAIDAGKYLELPKLTHFSIVIIVIISLSLIAMAICGCTYYFEHKEKKKQHVQNVANIEMTTQGPTQETDTKTDTQGQDDTNTETTKGRDDTHTETTQGHDDVVPGIQSDLKVDDEDVSVSSLYRDDFVSGDVGKTPGGTVRWVGAESLATTAGGTTDGRVTAAVGVNSGEKMEDTYGWIASTLQICAQDNWEKYLENFKTNRVDVERLDNLRENDWRELIPAMGPRNSFISRWNANAEEESGQNEVEGENFTK